MSSLREQYIISITIIIIELNMIRLTLHYFPRTLCFFYLKCILTENTCYSKKVNASNFYPSNLKREWMDFDNYKNIFKKHTVKMQPSHKRVQDDKYQRLT
jgi:hypothetical protein